MCFLADFPFRLWQAAAVVWEMLIVDGAHYLEWLEAATNPEVSSGGVPCTKTEVFLLLTATLEELGTESYFARLRLSNTEPLPESVVRDGEGLVAQCARLFPQKGTIESFGWAQDAQTNHDSEDFSDLLFQRKSPGPRD